MPWKKPTETTLTQTIPTFPDLSPPPHTQFIPLTRGIQQWEARESMAPSTITAHSYEAPAPPIPPRNPSRLRSPNAVISRRGSLEHNDAEISFIRDTSMERNQCPLSI
jgi:hypothetical protein